MQTLQLQRALPSAAVLSALLPGLCTSQTRTKVFTSNVMDENRAKRITDHFTYMRNCKKYRLTLHNLFNTWRAQQKAKELDILAVTRLRKAQEVRDEVARMQELMKEKRVEQLKEQVRRLELEYKKAALQHKSALRQQERLKRQEQEEKTRYELLLEASRRWIRHSELEDRINEALDSPQPFGFIAHVPPTEKL